MNWRLELDSRDNLSTSRSKVSTCVGDAVPQVTEAVGNASVAVILRSRKRTSNIQVGICPSVEDIEEIRTEREFQALLDRVDLAKAQLFAGISPSTEIAEVWLGRGVGSGSRICPRGGVKKERGVGVNIVAIETM